jgi:fructokinase
MILVCGEALVDLFVGAPSPFGSALEAVPGGSPFNVAIALAGLGREVALLSGVSEDAFGQMLMRRLVEGGVDTRYLVRNGLKTTLSVVATDPHGEPSYAFYAEHAADRAVTESDLPVTLPDSVTAIVAGSYALGVDPVAGALEALIRKESGKRLISLDPNVRPRILDSVASFRDRFERLIPYATILKASAEDVELFYRSRDLSAVAREWSRRGPRLVIVTRGEAGVLAAFGGAILERPARPVAVVDTVGAGDAFHAGVLGSLDARGHLSLGAAGTWTEDTVRHALDLACAAAALACTSRGAIAPSWAEVEAFLTRATA